ncbi:ead/Ea22-like family protein [Salmonella enterica]|nr:ead/Ea22-like family protein [Salmonella enterica]EBA6266128.1 ead/Ea22-like family protein [Salmonella enterica]
MSNIDKQALREAAERATPAMERLLMLPVDDDLLSEQELKDYGVDIDALNAFKFLTGPETVLALLDELEHYKSREERVTKLVLDNSTSWDVLYEKLEAAEKRIAEQREYYEGVIADGSKRIAELEKGHQEAAKQINSWRRLAKQNIAERGKDISELEAARQRIAELEAREVTLPPTFWYEHDDLSRDIPVLDKRLVKKAIRAAGIKVKES